MKTMFLFLVLAAGMTSSFARAGEEVSQDEIRSLVQRGELLSLETIMSLYPEEEFGKLLDLEVEQEHGDIIYELEFLHANGLIVELKIDARNGKLLEQEVED